MSKKIFDTFKFKCGAGLRNRILMTPMTIQAGYFDGGATSEMIDYYQFRAGDASAVIIENCFVENHGRGLPEAVNIDNDDEIPGLKRLAKATQAKGSEAILQPYHAGRMTNPKFNEGERPTSANLIAALRPDTVPPREMTHAQINQMIGDFGEATRRAIEARLDGVGAHGTDTYLLQQFFSPHSNRRQDSWGDSHEKRTQFPIEVLAKIQHAVAEEETSHFIIGYRFSPEEIEEPGICFENTMFLLNTLVEYEPDYFHISANNYQRTSIVN